MVELARYPVRTSSIASRDALLSLASRQCSRTTARTASVLIPLNRILHRILVLIAEPLRISEKQAVPSASASEGRSYTYGSSSLLTHATASPIISSSHSPRLRAGGSSLQSRRSLVIAVRAPLTKDEYIDCAVYKPAESTMLVEGHVPLQVPMPLSLCKHVAVMVQQLRTETFVR